MNTKKKIEKARIHLIVDQPFYATFALELDLKEDKKLPYRTAATDGKYIYYDPEFIDSLSIKEIETLLVHEILHVAHCHHIRRQERNPINWNLATDCAINPIIFEDFPRINGAVYIEKYKGWAAEMIYPELPEPKIIVINLGARGRSNEKGIEIDGEQKRIIGEVKDLPQGTSPAEEEARVEELNVRALYNAEAAGKLPANLKRRINKLLRPKVPWERLLANWINEKAKNDYSWIKRNPRIKSYYFPGLYSEELGTIVIVVDSSGSIDQNLYDRFISEINGLRLKYKFDCWFMSCDTKVYNPKRYSRNQPIDYENVSGGGGTDFRPPFKWIKKNIKEKVVGLIYFTDLYCTSYPNPSSFDVLWINYGNPESNYRSTVPFGKVIDIRD